MVRGEPKMAGPVGENAVPGQGLLENLQYEHYHNDYHHHYYQRAYHPSPPSLTTFLTRHANGKAGAL
jgi:hypothetical protein